MQITRVTGGSLFVFSYFEEILRLKAHIVRSAFDWSALFCGLQYNLVVDLSGNALSIRNFQSAAERRYWKNRRGRTEVWKTSIGIVIYIRGHHVSGMVIWSSVWRNSLFRGMRQWCPVLKTWQCLSGEIKKAAKKMIRNWGIRSILRIEVLTPLEIIVVYRIIRSQDDQAYQKTNKM